MAVPIKNFTTVDILAELGNPSIDNMEGLFNFSGIDPAKLNPSYCSGLLDLRALPYQVKKWRGYGGTSCGTPVPYPGGQSYPTEVEVTLGSGTGIVTLTPVPYDRPDRFIVHFNVSAVIDTGYISTGFSNSYDYGGSNRGAFKNSLQGKIIPLVAGNLTYPNSTLYPEDGYPRVTKVTHPATYTFNKILSIVTKATVRVYAPVGSTAWQFELSCPVP